MSESKEIVVKPAVTAHLAPTGGLIPTDFEGMYRMSQIMAASKLMPKGVETPEAVFVAIQMGMEVGLSPMASVQNVAVINGRPSLWGDAVLAVVRGSGLLEDFDEGVEGEGEQATAYCRAKRKGQATEIFRTFSVADAKRAGLWGKSGPWQQYPRRMLQMRARSWTLRDGFGDLLRGFRTAEELSDEPVDVTPVVVQATKDKITELKNKLKGKGKKTNASKGDPNPEDGQKDLGTSFWTLFDNEFDKPILDAGYDPEKSEKAIRDYLIGAEGCKTVGDCDEVLDSIIQAGLLADKLSEIGAVKK